MIGAKGVELIGRKMHEKTGIDHEKRQCFAGKKTKFKDWRG